MESKGTTQINSEGAPSYVSLYIHSNELTQEQAQAIIGSKGGTIRNPNSYHKWMWSGPWKQYDDSAQSVRDFVGKVLPKILPAITKIQKEYTAEVNLHLVIGIAKVRKTGEWPDINIDPTSLSELGSNGISLNIYLEKQMS
jgi:hypothetical protein